jgi:hypothetical protein
MDLSVPSRFLTAGLCGGVTKAGARHHTSGAVLSARPIAGTRANRLIKRPEVRDVAMASALRFSRKSVWASKASGLDLGTR